MKAQVADEGVVQDIAPVAAPADLAGGVAELELDALNQRGVVLQRLSDVTPKNHEMLASGRLQCGEITLLCGDGGVGKGQFVAQIARSLTMGEATTLRIRPILNEAGEPELLIRCVTEETVEEMMEGVKP